MNNTLRADLFLLLVALIWGATFPLVKASLPFISSSLFVALRFSFAGVFFLFLLLPKLKKTSPYVLWAGLILGLLNAMLYLSQTFGMRHVDADTSAFIAAVGVVFVPFLSPLFGLAKVKPIEVVGSLVCVIGLYILTGANFKGLTIDELWILLASVAWATSVCYLQHAAPRIKELNLLAFYQVVFLLPMAFIAAALEHTAPSVPVFKPIVIFSLLYTGILATAVVFLIQVRFQKDTTATHAAIIYSLEPVLASFIAIYVNNEALTRRVVGGGAIILASILLIELVPRLRGQLKNR